MPVERTKKKGYLFLLAILKVVNLSCGLPVTRNREVGTRGYRLRYDRHSRIDILNMPHFDIKNLYYITHVNNIPSILVNGIFSHDEIERQQVDFTPIYDTQIVSKRKIMAECLIPHKISPEFIDSIFVTDIKTQDKVKSLVESSTISIIPDPYLFFQPNLAKRIDNISLVVCVNYHRNKVVGHSRLKLV